MDPVITHQAGSPCSKIPLSIHCSAAAVCTSWQASVVCVFTQYLTQHLQILRTYHEPNEYHDCLHPHISINALFQECGDVKQAKVDGFESQDVSSKC